jgi:DNA-binding CsgD family transcriptional regulator
MMKDSAKVAQIRQLCCMGLGSQVIMPSLLRTLRDLVPSDSAGFFWIDSRGDMRNLYAERMLPNDTMTQFFHRHYDGGEFSFRKAYLQRVASAEAVIATSATTEMQRTAYYNNVLRELEAHYVLYAIIRDRGHAVGQLSLYRPKQAAPFSPKERAKISSVVHYIGHAIQQPLAATTALGNDRRFRDSDDEGMLVVDRNGGVCQASPGALGLLLMATTDQINAASVPAAYERAAGAVFGRLIKTIQSVYRDHPTSRSPPRAYLENAWGRFSVRAYCLSDEPLANDALFAIQITRQEPALLQLAEAMQRFPISPQQREAGLLLAQGKSNNEIAEVLGVKVNTASYHLKQLFAKLDVHSRQEAVDKLLGY